MLGLAWLAQPGPPVASQRHPFPCRRITARLHAHHQLTMSEPREPLSLRCSFSVTHCSLRRVLCRRGCSSHHSPTRFTAAVSAISTICQCESVALSLYDHATESVLSMAIHSFPLYYINHQWWTWLYCIDRNAHRMTASSSSCH